MPDRDGRDKRTRVESTRRKRSPSSSRSPSRSRRREASPVQIQHDECAVVDEAEQERIMRTMGIPGFGSTKGLDHTATDESSVKTGSRRKYRQFMNRRGGFDKPLDKTF